MSEGNGKTAPGEGPAERLARARARQPTDATAAIVLADGTVLWGRGLGAATTTTGEICFNTSMTGYQEIMTDPSYAGQLITFTFPHVGNVGTTPEDIETMTPVALGAILREVVTDPANWRSERHFGDWLAGHGLPGISGVDTRAMTHRVRDAGAPHATLAHRPDGVFDLEALQRAAADWAGLEGMDLAGQVSCLQAYKWDETLWSLGEGYGRQESPRHRVVAIDYGAKRNILRCLASAGCEVTVVPASATAEEILAHQPDGIFLANGPGDPAATGAYAVPTLRKLMEDPKLPIFGICLGHQLLALALGARTRKMHLGHHGANHPVRDLASGRVEITSQNHGFVVVEESLPDNVEPTHVSLFDGTNEGLKVKDRPIFSVQYHPEASPGPMDSHYLFDRFVEAIEKAKA